ncbi:DUF4876 domain-containing protein [Chitinophaga sp. Cy-1792]|uniref:DUF4876 domain-containing protein n=1 Tax=Chitinophaga sp. Cy-1792 TaxID=2608339 RepID=UPI001421A8AF|nr:DUF4876 domain-containing protein [Chitinophaga sp. Cy-1792]NIG55507.1 DUF4876 domain-containing protein [Chitinophaga sp. Cy-1792]
MRLTKLFFVLLTAGACTFVACKKDGISISKTNVAVSLQNPQGLEGVKTSNLNIIFKEVNSGVSTTFTINNAAELSKIVLAEGSYNVSLEGDIEYNADGVTQTGKVRGFQQGVVVKGGSFALNLSLFLYNTGANFVFREIFFTGTVTPEGKQYNGDKYFIIYNNSADTLYADGLVIAEAAFLSTTKRAYTPDIMKDTFSAGSVVMIPGNGKDYPVLPGKQIVIANNAINHKEYNANSMDLTGANFELTLLSSINVDNPQVPDLINVTTAMTMHNRGFKSYVLARFPAGVTPISFKANNLYTYSYVNDAGGTTKSTGYTIANNWILDAVNLSIPSDFAWILTSPALDMGWSYCGKVDGDNNRYGKAVRRQVLSTNPDGRVILQDNNNSTLDFDPEVKPSLMP